MQVLKPFLEAKRDQTFPDPQAFTNDSDFAYAAKVTSIYKKVVQEIFVEVEKWVQAAEFYRKKAQGEVKDPFAIGKEGE